MNKFDIAPKLRPKVVQEYPKETERKGITEKLSLNIYVVKLGKVAKAKIIHGIPEPNRAAINAIKRAKFKPAK